MMLDIWKYFLDSIEVSVAELGNRIAEFGATSWVVGKLLDWLRT
jgi:hypothetical protein